MSLNLTSAEAKAQKFLGTTEPLVRLGWGIGGFVFLSSDGRSAVKIFKEPGGFQTELRAYLILKRAGIQKLHGLNVPTLKGNDESLGAIQLDVVSPPFLLDFAGVQFSKPDFSDDVNEFWHAQIKRFYGEHRSIAYFVYDSLAKLGIYYLDFRPSNMRLDGLPGVKPTDFDPPDEDL